ncbi:MAG TPA: hypothetical protein VJS13_04070 [Pyrinomonadaceae bacterium]|nr:hypothetical protein [Pyrinomonadaceae bacterium]
MAQNLEKQLIDKVRALPPHKQQEVLRLLDMIVDVNSPPIVGSEAVRPMWEVVEEVNADLPSDTWDNVPTDGSLNLDHYLYGAPKRQS